MGVDILEIRGLLSTLVLAVLVQVLRLVHGVGVHAIVGTSQLIAIPAMSAVVAVL